MKLNLGSGPIAAPGWVNVDYSLGARLARIPLAPFAFTHKWDRSLFICDLRKRFPWPDESADAIYCSHFLEHLSHGEGATFLNECARVLKPGAPIRVVVPDLAAIVSGYNAGDVPAEKFVDALEVSYSNSASRLRTLLAPLVECPHKCMYDEVALLRAFWDAGFKARPRGAFDSDIPHVSEIEQADRTRNAVIAEATKSRRPTA